MTGDFCSTPQCTCAIVLKSSGRPTISMVASARSNRFGLRIGHWRHRGICARPLRAAECSLMSGSIKSIGWRVSSRVSWPMRAEAVLGEEVETACLIEWSFDGGRGSTYVDWRARPERKITTFISREGRSIEVNHEHRYIKLEGQILGPWADDEYESMLRDFMSRYYERHSPNDRTSVRALSLILAIYILNLDL